MSWHDLRPADFPGEDGGGPLPYEFISIYRRHFTLPPDSRGQRVFVEAELHDDGRLLARSSAQAVPGQDTVQLSIDGLGEVKLWDVDDPRLHEIRVRLRDAGSGDVGKPIHAYSTRIGFREARSTPEGFFLNGRRLQLFGLNRHQIFPYVGNAMSARVQRRDAEISYTPCDR